jgi:hypothetical protein
VTDIELKVLVTAAPPNPGDPIANAEIEVRARGGHPKVLRTDERGVATVRVAPGTVEVVAHLGRGCTPKVQTATLGQAGPASLGISLPAAFRLEGNVVGAKGAREIRLLLGDRGSVKEEKTIAVDPAGRFSAWMEHRIEILRIDAVLPDGTGCARTLVPYGRTKMSGVDLDFGSGTLLEVEVRDEAGTALSGVSVQLADKDKAGPKGSTDGLGGWGAVGLKPSTYRLSLRKEGYAALEASVEVPAPAPARLTRSYQMKRPPFVRGTFVGQGRPIIAFEVILEREGLPGRKLLSKAANGRFDFPDVSSLAEEPGESQLLLSFTNQYYVNLWRRPVRMNTDETIPLELGGQGTLRLAKADPSLLPNAQIEAKVRSKALPTGQAPSLDPEGRTFRFSPTVPISVMGLAEGLYEAWIPVRETARAESVEFWVVAQMGVDLEFELSPKGSSGRIAKVFVDRGGVDGACERLRLLWARAPGGSKASLRRTVEAWRDSPSILEADLKEKIARLLREFGS